ncbi:MAG: hypothetical protein Q4E22_03195 [Coriobacteriia bacterium]|nr:hypothetical protein [Coriobacteriia bacterium]
MSQEMQHEKISKALDSLTSQTFEESFNQLADTKELWPMLALEDEQGNRELISFSDDEKEECLKAARAYLQMQGAKGIGKVAAPVRYAIAYDAEVQDEVDQKLKPAVIVEFGEKGSLHAYSGYSFYKHGKKPEDFLWSEPQAAGFEDLLL